MGFRGAMRRVFWRDRGLGMIPNDIDARDFEYSAKGVMSLDDDGEISLEKYATVVDQGRTNSCVGNAVAGAVWIMEQKSSHEYGYPSRGWLYWHARYRHQGVNVTDSGTHIRECCKALFKVGVPDEEHWPFSRLRINNRPEFGMFMHADPRKGGEYHSIKVVGDARLNAIRGALSEGKPVVFGTSLAKSFMSAKGSSLIGKPKGSDEIVGRHAMAIIGCKKVNGEERFRVLNSWGKYWRDNGKCWLTDEYITWGRTRDLTVISGWERLRS